MTVPGPIQPLPIPDVRPSWFQADQSPERMQQAIRLLVQSTQANHELAAKQAQLAQLQSTQNAAGSTLRDMLVQAGTQTVPTVPGVTAAPITVEGPLATAFKGKPGSAVFDAVRYGAGPIDAELKRLTQAKTINKPTGKQIDENGFVYNVYADGSTKQVFQPDRKTPLTVPTKVPTPTGTWQRVAIQPDGNVHWRNFATGEDYFAPSTLPASSLPGAQKKNAASDAAAGYLIPALNAYDRLRQLGPLNIDPINYMGAFKLASTGNVAEVTKWMAQNAVSAHDRAIIETMIPFVQAVAHSQGGKRITDAQLQQYIQSLTPFANDTQIKFPDGTDMLGQKDRIQRSHLLALYMQALPSLQGKGIPDLTAKWPDLQNFNLPDALQRSGPPVVPGTRPDNPFAAPAPASPNAPPPLLRKP